MQNTNQPQTFYTQPGMPAPAPQVGTQAVTPQQPQKGGKMKPKQLLAVAGLVLFIIVAVMGVLIAQRQVTKPGEDVTPVAPTAPDSQPSASTYQPNNCVTVFNVPAPFAECASKVALTNFTSAGGKSIPAGSQFNVGDEFVFSLTVSQPGAGTVTNVKLIDTLPNSLSFVSGPTNPPYTITSNGQVVTATIPQIGSNSTVKVEFKVRVTSSDFGKGTNSAYVENLGLEKADKLCSYDFETVKGVTECVDKTLYTLSGKLVANGAALVRGQEYEYRVTAKATNQSLGEVKVHDVLPKELDYVRPAAGSEKYITNDPNSGLLTANFGVMKDETKTLGFIMKVPNDIEVGTFTNTALVYAFPPTSKQPEPPANADECSVSHAILPIGTAECIEKEAFTNFGGQEITPNTAIKPGDEFVYKITVTADQTTTGPVTVVDELHRDLTFIQDSGNTEGINYNSSTRTVSIDLGVMTTGQTKVVEFKVQLSANPQDKTFKNVAVINTNDDTKHTCEIPLKVEQKTYSCNSACETNENCTGVNSGYICYDSGSGKFCRLANNPSDTSCKAATPTPTPTPQVGCNDTCTTNADCMNDAHICAQTSTGNRCRLAEYVSSPDCRVPVIATATPTPTPTPAPGCNDTCVQNADCSNVNHICVSTDDGSMRCRLAEYTSSANCSVPTTTIAQPVLPEQLPQTGPEDWLNWLKAGLVTLGIGTALFLLL